MSYTRFLEFLEAMISGKIYSSYRANPKPVDVPIFSINGLYIKAF